MTTARTRPSCRPSFEGQLRHLNQRLMVSIKNSSSRKPPPDYTLLYREQLTEAELRASTYDLSISIYDGSDRCQLVLGGIAATRAVCFLIPQYGFSGTEITKLRRKYR